MMHTGMNDEMEVGIKADAPKVSILDIEYNKHEAFLHSVKSLPEFEGFELCEDREWLFSLKEQGSILDGIQPVTFYLVFKVKQKQENKIIDPALLEKVKVLVKAVYKAKGYQEQGYELIGNVRAKISGEDIQFGLGIRYIPEAQRKYEEIRRLQVTETVLAEANNFAVRQVAVLKKDGEDFTVKKFLELKKAFDNLIDKLKQAGIIK